MVGGGGGGWGLRGDFLNKVFQIRCSILNSLIDNNMKCIVATILADIKTKYNNLSCEITSE